MQHAPHHEGESHPAAGPFAAEILARHVVAMRFDDITPAAIRAARHCLIDAVGCAIFGARFAWSHRVKDYAVAVGAGGPCRLTEVLEPGLALPPAALCLGAFAHAFELDSLRKPGAGVHPGATVALPALLAAQMTRASGRDLLRAIVAGCEVMFRIGDATLHTSESRGFHAPGITGAFGAATAAGLLLGLDARQMAQAYGIAGSMAGGLLAFARAGQGGMVKRLHLGRAAEGGCAAALLAKAGFEGPASVLEGTFGVLEAFCAASDPARLTRGLGQGFAIETLCLKHYACHVTAQAPVELLRGLMAQHGFAGADIADMSLKVSDKVLSHHAGRTPGDVMLAQYSVPFCVAIAAFRDPENALAFSDDVLADPDIVALAGRLTLEGGMPKGWGVEMQITLRDGRRIAGQADHFLGCPETPFTDVALRGKFLTLAAEHDTARMAALLDWLEGIELVTDGAEMP